MRKNRSIWPWVLGGLTLAGGGLAVAVAVSRRPGLLPATDPGSLRLDEPGHLPPGGWPSAPSPGQPSVEKVDEPARSSNSPDDATDDETALARMLASEVDERRPRAREERIIMGWLTSQRARNRKDRSIYSFVTTGKGYGPQWDDRYASTANRPTAVTRALARELLAGAVQPSAAIRRHRPGSWIERGQGVSDEAILLKQAETYTSPKTGKPVKGFGEGIYARVAGTRWVLYSRDAPPISLAPFLTATARLDAVPTVPALDVMVS